MKYRILEKGENFLPQYKNIFGFWSNFSCGRLLTVFCSIQDAKTFLEKEQNGNKIKIHSFP